MTSECAAVEEPCQGSAAPAVIVRLNGGLGNQLFQYACGRAVALRSGLLLKLNVNAFGGDTKRTYRLNHFAIRAEIATIGEVRAVRGSLWHRWLEWARPRGRRTVVVERSFAFDADILGIRRPVYLDGYWQSERYFKDVEDAIREELQVSTPPGSRTKAMLRRVDSPCSVSLHVRRGDYVSSRKANAYHGLCSVEYYEAAVREIRRRVPAAHFYVFSDDISWARANLALEGPVTFVDHNGSDAEYDDLRVMSACAHHVVANSTFSWWGAWLGAGPDKVIVAPKQWFATAGVDGRDICPPSWVRV